jgi:hypothetical protein
MAQNKINEKGTTDEHRYKQIFIRFHPFHLWLNNIGNKHEKNIKPFIREQEL